MKKLGFQSFIALAVFIFAATSVFAQPDDMRRKKKNRMQNIPDLTEEQENKIKKIYTDTKKFILPIRNELKEKEAHLQTVSTAEKTDMNEIYKTLEKISALKLKIAKKREEAKQSVRSLLTDDQRVHFDTHSGKHRKDKKHHKKHGRDR